MKHVDPCRRSDVSSFEGNTRFLLIGSIPLISMSLVAAVIGESWGDRLSALGGALFFSPALWIAIRGRSARISFSANDVCVHMPPSPKSGRQGCFDAGGYSLLLMEPMPVFGRDMGQAVMTQEGKPRMRVPALYFTNRQWQEIRAHLEARARTVA